MFVSLQHHYGVNTLRIKPKSDMQEEIEEGLICNEFSKFEVVDIDEVVSLGEREEDVYDMEVEGTHCFFANNILVHNSSFNALGIIARYFGIPDKEMIPFLEALDEYGIQPYLMNYLDVYAKGMGCQGNLLNLKVDDIAEDMLIYAKNKYAVITDKKDKSTGIPTISTTQSEFTRELMKDFIKWVFSAVRENDLNPINMGEKVMEIYSTFHCGSIDDVSTLVNVGDVLKGVSVKPSLGVVKFPMGAMPQTKASGYYNLSIRRDATLRNKYKLIQGDEAIRYYYTTSEEYPIYGYPAGCLPIEVAPEPDYGKMFKVLVLPFINDTIRLFGMPTISDGLFE